jgi:Zn-dependent protease with chaperone function
MRFRRHQEAAQAGTRQLVALFVLVVAGLTLAVNGALALAYRVTVPWATGYPDWFFATNTALVLLYVLGGCAVESLRLREGGAHVARLAGAREASRTDALERRLAHVVAEMAIAANTTPPAAWVLPREDAINAFAAGWGADDAVVAVTRGALERLDRAELQGVVAHELSHLVHGDTRLNMRLIGMVWGLRLLFDLGRELTEPDTHGRRHVGVLFGVALMAVGALGWAAGRLLQAAVSRQREFLADASAVKYTRQVAGLGGALRKVAEQQRAHADTLSARTGTLAHLFLVSSSFGAWWATHPPLAERIRRLYGREMPGLSADPLPPPAAGDEPALAALVPSGSAGAGSPAQPQAATVAAAHHDAVQRPALADARVQRAAREAEALARIARWQGPGELRAALLTLLRPAAAPPDAAAWQPLPAARAAAMQADLAALGPATRLAVLDALARRMAQAPAVAHRAVRAEARAAARSPGIVLRWLLLRHRLRARPLPFAAPNPRNTLAARRADVALATQVLADVIAAAAGADTARAAAWARRAHHALRIADVATPTATPRAALRALARLQRLAALQRPLPVRAWVQAWDGDEALGASDDVAAVLTTAAHLLEVPLPPALAARVPQPF